MNYSKNIPHYIPHYIFLITFLLSCAVLVAQVNIWQPTNSQNNFPVFCLTTIDSDLYAGMMGAGVFKTADEGETWESLNEGLADLYATQIVAKDELLFVSTYHDGVYRLPKTKLVWEKTNTELPNQVNTLLVKDQFLFAGTNKGLYKTRDEGDTWEKLNLPITSTLQRPILSLSIVNNNVLAGTRRYIFWSSDNGDTWERVDTGVNSDIAQILVYNNKLYLGTSAHGILESSLTGRSWVPTSNNIEGLKNIYALIQDDKDMVIGVPTRGVVKKNNLINEYFPTSAVRTLTWHKGKLYAGTFLDGVWKYDLPITIKPRIAPSPIVGIYPNPTTPTIITFSYQLEEVQEISISLVDSNGKLLQKIVEGTQTKGIHRQPIDASSLTPGVYYCLFLSDNVTHTKKVIVQHP